MSRPAHTELALNVFRISIQKHMFIIKIYAFSVQVHRSPSNKVDSTSPNIIPTSICQLNAKVK